MLFFSFLFTCILVDLLQLSHSFYYWTYDLNLLCISEFRNPRT